MLERPISKAGWTRVRFGQIATQINDRVDKPVEAGVERYVGLEHLDPDSLRIRRWGDPSDVESTKLRFQPGDIIVQVGKTKITDVVALDEITRAPQRLWSVVIKRGDRVLQLQLSG